ncbi:MAG: 4Fe-4S binding protein [Thermodesulfovibrionales bacterium]|nr:4Fe-4S binding protein [Thermodesulfovibrionales bacterium]
MNTVKDSQESRVMSYELKDKETLNSELRTPNSLLKLSNLRRFVMFSVLIFFLLQFFRVKALVGGLSGSLARWFVKLIDVFAYFESLAASKDFTTTTLIAVVPIIGIYLIFGRAFCGWVCPMDFLFEIVDGFKNWSKVKVKASPKIGYGIAAGLLVVSGLLGIPFFTNYISHLTNFFRFITGGVFLALNLPFEPSVLVYSGGVIVFLLVFEYIFPRTWCRVLCPVGKTYGLFNKVSLLKLKYYPGECGECNLCDRLCYMNVKIARHIDQPGLRDINCIYCGRCAEGCETKGKLVKLSLK